MGYPYNALIPAAILLDNPGITREEFVELLNQTHSSNILEIKKHARWSSFGRKKRETEDEKFHGGLHGLARVLCLKHTRCFEELEEKDIIGYRKYPPVLFIEPRKGGEKWTLPEFGVEFFEHFLTGKVEEVTALSFDKLEKGKIWDDVCGLDYGLVEEIFEEIPFGNLEEEEEDSGPRFEYRMKIQVIGCKKKKEKFETIEELVKKYPFFNPDFMYDFSAGEGELETYSVWGQGNFRWTKINSKYYLEKEHTFSHIPVSMGYGKGFGYTDLILTAEAIRQKAWKLLSYRGKDHLKRFLKMFPDSKERYERAIWGYYTSFGAKERGLTNSEFLRWRLLGLREL